MTSEKVEKALNILARLEEEKMNHNQIEKLFKQELDLDDEQVGYLVEILLERNILEISDFGNYEGEVYTINEVSYNSNS